LYDGKVVEVIPSIISTTVVSPFYFTLNRQASERLCSPAWRLSVTHSFSFLVIIASFMRG